MLTATEHGFPILARKSSINGGEIVIAHRTDVNTPHPFVVWRMSERGMCEGGDYCADLVAATRAFAWRV